WCVTPYKKPAANIPENKTFNYWVSHVCIQSEHAVEFLKGHFQSLKGLHQQIKNPRTTTVPLHGSMHALSSTP
ncbi:hypothetical protein L208DRAFT_1333976, partial [Tricholoma matsutake]